jgi:hypothetical protein
MTPLKRIDLAPFSPYGVIVAVSKTANPCAHHEFFDTSGE